MRLASDEPEHRNLAGRMEATRQLQAVMSGQVQNWWRKPIVLAALGLLTLCGMGLGYGLAQQSEPSDLLGVEIETQPDEAGIERQETIEAQYREARWSMMAANASTGESTSAALETAALNYQAVLDFHPVPSDADSEEYYTTKYFHLLSRQQLGEIFWLQNDWFAANEQFKLLKNEPGTFQIFRLHGLIGNAMYLDEVERDELETLQVLKQLDSEMQDQQFYLLNEFFSDQLTSLYNKYPYEDGLRF